MVQSKFSFQVDCHGCYYYSRVVTIIGMFIVVTIPGIFIEVDSHVLPAF